MAREARPNGWTTVQKTPSASSPGWHGAPLTPQARVPSGRGEPCAQQQARPGSHGQLTLFAVAVPRGASDASAGAAP